MAKIGACKPFNPQSQAIAGNGSKSGGSTMTPQILITSTNRQTNRGSGSVSAHSTRPHHPQKIRG